MLYLTENWRLNNYRLTKIPKVQYTVSQIIIVSI